MDMSAQNRPWPSNTSALDLRKAIRSSSRRSNSFGHTTDDTCADLTCYKSVYIDHSRTMRHLRTHCEFVGELFLKSLKGIRPKAIFANQSLSRHDGKVTNVRNYIDIVFYYYYYYPLLSLLL